MTAALTSTCFLSLSVRMSLPARGTTRRTKTVFCGGKTTSSKRSAVSPSPASSTSSGGKTLTPVHSKVWYRKRGMCDAVKSASLTGPCYQGDYRWQPQPAALHRLFFGTFFTSLSDTCNLCLVSLAHYFKHFLLKGYIIEKNNNKKKNKVIRNLHTHIYCIYPSYIHYSNKAVHVWKAVRKRNFSDLPPFLYF